MLPTIRIVLLLLLGLARIGLAGPWPTDDALLPTQAQNVALPASMIMPLSPDHTAFRSVALLNDQCSAFFIDSHGAPGSPAYLLTAAHCVEDISPLNENLIVQHQRVMFRALFNRFTDTLHEAVPVGVDQIAYSTLKGMDIAVLRTDRTVAQMGTLGLEPLVVAERLPAVGSPVTLTAMANGNALTVQTCTLQPPVDLVQGPLHFYGFLGTRCRAMIGMAGGALLGPTGEGPAQVIGLLSSGTESAPWQGITCATGHPCAVTANGLLPQRQHSFGTPLVGVGHCFSEGVLHVENHDCPLPLSSGLAITDPPPAATGNQAQRHTWGFSVNRLPRGLKRKIINVTTARHSCQDLDGYADTPADFDFAGQRLPADDGVYQYCLLPTDAASAREADAIMVTVTNLAPNHLPDVQLHREAGEPLVFFPGTRAADLDYAYWLTSTSQPCPTKDNALYQRIGQAQWLRLPRSPGRLCAYALDAANNTSDVKGFDY